MIDEPPKSSKPATCRRCGVETRMAGSFFTKPRSFSGSTRTYCPACWSKRQHSVAKWTLLYNLGDNPQPLTRPLMLNNIAYTNALLGGDELLKQADEFSQAAMTTLGSMPAVRGTRGAVLAAMGRFEEGLPLLHESMVAADLSNDKATNACLISMAEARRGNLDVARNYLEEARKLEPKCSLLSRAEAVWKEANPSRV